MREKGIIKAGLVLVLHSWAFESCRMGVTPKWRCAASSGEEKANGRNKRRIKYFGCERLFPSPSSFIFLTFSGENGEERGESVITDKKLIELIRDW